MILMEKTCSISYINNDAILTKKHECTQVSSLLLERGTYTCMVYDCLEMMKLIYFRIFYSLK